METLALIANAYNPALLLITVLVCVKTWRKGSRLPTVEFLLMVVVAYGWMFADKATGAFAAIGLDYSTHTATAIAMLLIIVPRVGMPSRCIAIGSFLIYAVLMKILGYHPYLDVIATAVLIFASYLIVYFVLKPGRNTDQTLLS